jgi:predicted HAD superfamily phosphohydrolase YqeG
MKHLESLNYEHDFAIDMMKSLALMQYNSEEYFMVGDSFFEGVLEEEHEGMSVDQISELYIAKYKIGLMMMIVIWF